MRFLIIGISIISLLIASFSCGSSTGGVDPRAFRVTYSYSNISGSDLVMQLYDREDGGLMNTYRILDNEGIRIGPLRGPFRFASRRSQIADTIIIKWLNLNKCLTYEQKELPDINNGVRSIFQEEFYEGYQEVKNEDGTFKKTVFTLYWDFTPIDLRNATQCKE